MLKMKKLWIMITHVLDLLWKWWFPPFFLRILSYSHFWCNFGVKSHLRSLLGRFPWSLCVDYQQWKGWEERIITMTKRKIRFLQLICKYLLSACSVLGNVRDKGNTIISKSRQRHWPSGTYILVSRVGEAGQVEGKMTARENCEIAAVILVKEDRTTAAVQVRPYLKAPGQGVSDAWTSQPELCRLFPAGIWKRDKFQ